MFRRARHYPFTFWMQHLSSTCFWSGRCRLFCTIGTLSLRYFYPWLNPSVHPAASDHFPYESFKAQLKAYPSLTFLSWACQHSSREAIFRISLVSPWSLGLRTNDTTNSLLYLFPDSLCRNVTRSHFHISRRKSKSKGYLLNCLVNPVWGFVSILSQYCAGTQIESQRTRART